MRVRAEPPAQHDATQLTNPHTRHTQSPMKLSDLQRERTLAHDARATALRLARHREEADEPTGEVDVGGARRAARR
eukprot:1679514-Prymnesium_polylepis.1